MILYIFLCIISGTALPNVSTFNTSLYNQLSLAKNINLAPNTESISDVTKMQDDTKLLQELLDKGGNIKLDKRLYKVSKPLFINNGKFELDGNGATINFAYKQKRNSYEESLFVIKGVSNIKLSHLKLTYQGDFNLHESYLGYVSGIYAVGVSGLGINDVEASGFNRAGINLGTGAANVPYCNNPIVKNCNLHNNRVAGCMFGNTRNGSFINNIVKENGSPYDTGTGYGFTGWSENIPINTLVEGNKAVHNYRKGIDFHSGQNGEIVENLCDGNLIMGIYAVGVTGSWRIEGNSITNMKATNSTYFDMVGIEIGNDRRNKLATKEISFNLINNRIDNFGANGSDKGVYPIFIQVSNIGIGSIKIVDNTFNCNDVTSLIRTSAGKAKVSKYYDISISDNLISALNLSSVPIYLRGTNVRRASVINNKLNIGKSKNIKYLFLSDKSKIQGTYNKFENNQITIPIEGHQEFMSSPLMQQNSILKK